tara:strand:- start:153 stop:1316 length:1164 start_codon:yes stop_codon:yes gene_type:complete
MKNELTLPDCANITTGKLDSNASQNNGKYPFFTCAPSPLKINDYSFDCHAILLAGNNAAGNFHINRYDGKFNAYQRTYVITNKEGFNLDYLFYSIKMALIGFKRIAQGSQTKFLTMDILNSFPIVKRDITDQENLVKFISLLDKKISLNNKINEELEKMAKTLYDYWFVQFDFPNKQGKPYKSSGGKMVYNEELKREIPEELKQVFLDGKINFEKGVEPGTKNYFEVNDNNNLVPFFKVGDMEGDNTIWITKEVSGNSIAKEGDILVSFDGTVGRIVIGLNGAFSSGMRRISQKEEYFPKSYLYFLFKSQEIQKTIKKYATGSNIIHASDSIEVLSVPYNKDLVKLYNSKIENSFEIIIKIIKENKKLEQLRDFLLPLLMNGQVKVK